ncbi:MAG: hemolysin protein [Blastopirellula sp.]|nr:MAG: hemolysin protein [Blastopirellula sp.]
MTFIIVLFLTGVFLSAFFSGSETGFYRVSRIRLVLDGMEGNFMAKFLLILTNHPALFVATTLIGNNLANYLTSLAVVLFTQQLYSNSSTAELLLPQLLLPVLFSPILFIYGELLPKSLFFQMPNRLLRFGSPLFLLCTVLFAPFAGLLWLFGQFLQWLLGESPTHVRLVLARKELEDVLEEGSEVGILNSSQSRLAQGLFSAANRTVESLATPISKAQAVLLGSSKEDAIRLAKHEKKSVLAVVDQQQSLLGYVRVCDLRLNQETKISQYLELPELSGKQSIVSAITQLRSNNQAMASVLSQDQDHEAIVTFEQLILPVLSGAD